MYLLLFFGNIQDFENKVITFIYNLYFRLQMPLFFLMPFDTLDKSMKKKEKRFYQI